MAANVRHSSRQPKWGTGPEVINVAQHVLDAARRFYEGRDDAAIYVDPFSEPEFNSHVGAYRILTGEKGLDGYRDRWIDHELCPRADMLLAGIDRRPCPPEIAIARYTALVNPPGDDSGDNVKRAWRILVGYYELGWVDSAVWVAFNLNQMQTLQGEASLHPLSHDLARCVPDRRLPFTAHSSRPETRVDKKGNVVENDDAPSHPMFFVLLPSRVEVIAAEQMRLFDSMGSKLGAVL